LINLLVNITLLIICCAKYVANLYKFCAHWQLLFFTAVYLHCLLIRYCFYHSLVNEDFHISSHTHRRRLIVNGASPTACVMRRVVCDAYRMTSDFWLVPTSATLSRELDLGPVRWCCPAELSIRVPVVSVASARQCCTSLSDEVVHRRWNATLIRRAVSSSSLARHGVPSTLTRPRWPRWRFMLRPLLYPSWQPVNSVEVKSVYVNSV